MINIVFGVVMILDLQLTKQSINQDKLINQINQSVNNSNNFSINQSIRKSIRYNLKLRNGDTLMRMRTIRTPKGAANYVILSNVKVKKFVN